MNRASRSGQPTRIAAGIAGGLGLVTLAAVAIGFAATGGLTTAANGAGFVPSPAAVANVSSPMGAKASTVSAQTKDYTVIGPVTGAQILRNSVAPIGATATSATASNGSSASNGSGTTSGTKAALGGRILHLNGVAIIEGSAGFEQLTLPNPAEFSMQVSAAAVTVGWSDGANSPDYNETGFTVYKRDNTGAWQPMHTVTARHNVAGDNYSWTDTSTSVSGQCYIVASIGAGNSGWSVEECTVRPDPSAFPQNPPASTVQWYGLSSANDGTAALYNANQDANLVYQGRPFGVSLGWDTAYHSNIKLQRQGNNNEPLMKGEAVALRVWGGGWLSYGQDSFGIDLHMSLSDAPSYQWYVVGDGAPGNSLDGGEFALWNKATGDYLVEGDQTWSINLNWYQKTISQPSNPVDTAHGVSRLTLFNCVSDDDPLEVWVWDITAGTGWVDKGELPSEWSDDGCPGGSAGFTFLPTSGHSYVVETVDFDAEGCSNDPEVSCEQSTTTFTGDSAGTPIQTDVS
jgi:hypothetical protein